MSPLSFGFAHSMVVWGHAESFARMIHPVWFIRDTLIKDIVRILATSMDRIFSYWIIKGQKTTRQLGTKCERRVYIKLNGRLATLLVKHAQKFIKLQLLAV